MAGQEDDDFLTKISALADEYKLEGEKREEFLEMHLSKKGGYKKVTSWVKDEGGSSRTGGSASGGWWK